MMDFFPAKVPHWNCWILPFALWSSTLSHPPFPLVSSHHGCIIRTWLMEIWRHANFFPVVTQVIAPFWDTFERYDKTTATLKLIHSKAVYCRVFFVVCWSFWKMTKIRKSADKILFAAWHHVLYVAVPSLILIGCISTGPKKTLFGIILIGRVDCDGKLHVCVDAMSKKFQEIPRVVQDVCLFGVVFSEFEVVERH